MKRRRPRETRRRAALPSKLRCVLDSGGLSALVGRSQRARESMRWILERGGRVVVPTPVLVEAITGDAGRDAEVNRVLGVLAAAVAVVVAPDEATARRAGMLRFRARTDDGIDALVASAAVDDRSACVVLTSDSDDLAKLLANDPQVAIRIV